MDLYLDCGNGISGDMTLAALVHLGLDIAPLASVLARAGVNCRIETWPETRVGGPGRRVDVSWDEVQPLRHPADIAAVFAVLDMGGAARQRALAVLEALTLAEKAGVDPELVYQAIRGGLAGSTVLDAKAPMMLSGNETPGFKVDLHKKDLANVLECAHDVGAPVPMTASVQEILCWLHATGHGDSDHSAIYRYYRTLIGEE